MSANMLLGNGIEACASCGASWEKLDPKSSVDGETYFCRCVNCSYEDFYVFPKTCLHCDYEDWRNYEPGLYPESCPSCMNREW